MGKFLTEFKEFAVKGNAIDMAVGVIIGGAFGKIVSSLVDDIIMPPIGWLIGGVNFSDLKVTLPAEKIAEANTDEVGHNQLRQLHPDAHRLPGHSPLHLPDD